MSVPEEARFEAEVAPGIAVYDVAALLPRHKTKKWKNRPLTAIEHLIVHKSGADGPEGFRGAKGSARFSVNHRGWAGTGYHFWISSVPDVDEDGRRVIYRLNGDEVWCWHTGGRMNRIGMGIAVQGRFSGEVGNRPNDGQVEMLDALVAYLSRDLGVELGHDEERGWGLTGHWEHGKPVCPGEYLKGWVRRKRSGASGHPAEYDSGPEDVRPGRFTTHEKQIALKALGYYTKKVDGIWGYGSRAALEAFQAQHGLDVDGVWGRQTSKAMSGALALKGYGTRNSFAALGGE